MKVSIERGIMKELGSAIGAVITGLIIGGIVFIGVFWLMTDFIAATVPNAVIASVLLSNLAAAVTGVACQKYGLEGLDWLSWFS